MLVLASKEEVTNGVGNLVNPPAKIQDRSDISLYMRYIYYLLFVYICTFATEHRVFIRYNKRT